jgi:hypothetical protein
VKKSVNEGFFFLHRTILHQFCKNAMHFYIIDGNFYLGRWQHMPPTLQVPSSLSDLCMDSIIIPNFQNQAAGAVFAVLPLFFLFQDAEGFAISSPSNHLFCLPIPPSPVLPIFISNEERPSFLWMTPEF